jgi:hypothetical protein
MSKTLRAFDYYGDITILANEAVKQLLFFNSGATSVGCC